MTVNVHDQAPPAGEFFFDKGASALRYTPASAAERAALLVGGLEAVAPLADRLLEINGTRGLTLRNISFRDTSYYAVGSWSGPAAEPSDGAVRINEVSWGVGHYGHYGPIQTLGTPNLLGA